MSDLEAMICRRCGRPLGEHFGAFDPPRGVDPADWQLGDFDPPWPGAICPLGPEGGGHV